MWYNNLNKGDTMIYTFGDTHVSHDIAKRILKIKVSCAIMRVIEF